MMKTETEHTGIKCGSCQKPLKGVRYMCLECDNFDLCGECENLQKHQDQHVMVIITDPMNKKSLQRLMRAKIESLDRELDASKASSIVNNKTEFSLEELSSLRMDIHPSKQEKVSVENSRKAVRNTEYTPSWDKKDKDKNPKKAPQIIIDAASLNTTLNDQNSSVGNVDQANNDGVNDEDEFYMS